MKTSQQIQRPINGIDLENRDEKLAEIEPGNFVWIGERDSPCRHGIHQVVRLTPTLFIVGKEANRYKRFYRKSGSQVDPSMFFSLRITGIATKSEIKAFEAAKLQRNEELARKAQENILRSEKRSDFNKMFSTASGIYVLDDDHFNSNPATKAWTVTIPNLSDADVAEVAKILKNFKKM